MDWTLGQRYYARTGLRSSWFLWGYKSATHDRTVAHGWKYYIYDDRTLCIVCKVRSSQPWNIRLTDPLLDMPFISPQGLTQTVHRFPTRRYSKFVPTQLFHSNKALCDIIMQIPPMPQRTMTVCLQWEIIPKARMKDLVGSILVRWCIYRETTHGSCGWLD